jgi:ribosomal-protein-alanine N-acetyltransferase
MLHKDLADVLALERETDTAAWSEENFLSEIGSACGYAFVARHDPSRLLGFLVFWMIADEVHLLKLAIHPDFRRYGLGKGLLAFLIGFAHDHGVRWIGLEVRKSNLTAMAMYRSFGFQQTSVRKAYYPDNHEDGIVMELRLDRELS